MSDENNTFAEGDGSVLPAASDTKPTPKSDAEAAQIEGGQTDTSDVDKEAAEAAAKAKTVEDGRKNRTREYIAKINRERAELAAEVATLKAAQKPATSATPVNDGRPTLEQHNFDNDAYLEALADWKVEQRLKAREESTKQAADARTQQETIDAYNTKVVEFADAHPDFQEVVGSIPYPLSDALQAAIMTHPKGPEIAYHLGNNDDDAFALASIQPALAAAAVERLAKRLTAAPATPETKPIKPVSQAPAPVTTVSGRSPAEVPPEKLTDDEWYRRESAKRRAK